MNVPAPIRTTHPDIPSLVMQHPDSPDGSVGEHGHIIKEDWSVVLKNKMALHIDEFHRPEVVRSQGVQEQGEGS